jgi:hypothetical protein
MTSKLPNFFVVGAAKAGTTSIYHYLNGHSDIYLSPIKEPHFFCSDFRYENFNSNYQRESHIDFPTYFSKPTLEPKHISFIENRQDYVSLFRDTTTQKAIGEASTGYLFSQTAAINIRNEVPSAKIIMILRHPVERAFSHFLMDLKAGAAPASNFRDAVTADMARKEKGWGVSSLYVELGMYYAQVKRYLDIFPPENVKVILFDDFKVDTIEVMSQIYKFLEVDEELALKVHSKFNKAVVPRFPRLHVWLVQTRLKRQLVSMMPKTLKQKIKDAYLVTAEQMKLTDQDISFAWPFFADDVKKLSALLGKDLSKWEPHV